MIGPSEKGFKRKKVIKPDSKDTKIDLTLLPQYISYKSALLREKTNLHYLLIFGVLIFSAYFVTSRMEVSDLHTKLREKEYILAPGVMDFTKASPHALPNNYIYDASMDFLSTLGNVSSTNIEAQYSSLKRFMSNELKVRFEIDTADWVEQVKLENISQILKVTKLETTSNNEGAYKIKAQGKVDFYAERQYLGAEDQVIEMVLVLVPPESGKRWYLQITSLQIEKAETFNKKTEFSTSKN